MNSNYSIVFESLIKSLTELPNDEANETLLRFNVEHKFRDFVSSFLLLLNTEITSGNYMNFQFKLEDHKDFTIHNIIDLLQKLQESSFKIEELVYRNENELKTQIISENLYVYIEIVKNSINKYGLLCYKLLKKHYNITRNFYKAEIFDDFINEKANLFKQEIILLNNIIELTKFDHNFVDSVIVQKSIFRLKNSLETLRFSNANYRKLKDCGVLKCDYLIYKWFKRYDKNHISDLNFDKNIFSNWIDKIDCQYEINGNWINILLNKFHLNRKKKTFLAIHDNIKFFKDIQKNADEILNYYKQLSSKKNGIQTLDSVSINISLQYILNNYFSSICATKEEKILKKINSVNSSDKTSLSNLFKNIEEEVNDLIIKYYNCIDKQKNKLNLFKIEYHHNYFIDYKLLKTIIAIFQQLSTNFEHKYALLSTFESSFIDLGERIKEYENKLKMSLLNNDNIFILPWSESIIKYKDVEIYFASSFLLPNKISSINNELEEIKRDYNKLDLLLSLKTEIIEINNLKDNYKNSNNKLIETVSIFTGIISFIVGSVSAYNFITTFNQALIFILSYGLSISIFIILIFIGTRGLKTLTDKWYLVFPYLFISILLTYLLFNEYKTTSLNTTTKEITNEINKQPV